MLFCLFSSLSILFCLSSSLSILLCLGRRTDVYALPCPTRHPNSTTSSFCPGSGSGCRLRMLWAQTRRSQSEVGRPTSLWPFHSSTVLSFMVNAAGGRALSSSRRLDCVPLSLTCFHPICCPFLLLHARDLPIIMHHCPAPRRLHLGNHHFLHRLLPLLSFSFQRTSASFERWPFFILSKFIRAPLSSTCFHVFSRCGWQAESAIGFRRKSMCASCKLCLVSDNNVAAFQTG